MCRNLWGIRNGLKVLAIKIVGIHNELLNLEQDQQTSAGSWGVGGDTAQQKWRLITLLSLTHAHSHSHTCMQAYTHIHTYKHRHDSHTYMCISVPTCITAEEEESGHVMSEHPVCK